MKYIRSFSLIVLLGICSLNLSAAIPANYYDSANGKQGQALLQALHDIIDGHDPIEYGSLEDCYAVTDLRPDGSNTIWDMYSTCTFYPSDANCSQNRVCQCWNKEHSVPSSWFKKATPMYSDLFHVIPTDARVNNFRSNMPFGETSLTAYVAGDSHSLGHIGSSSFSGYSGQVYEPDDEYKGDLARNYLYMATRYLDKDFTKSTEGTAVFTYSGGRAALTSYAIALFMKWHRQDPVSQKEIDRNNAIYENYQHNRNPFIDYPYLAEYIWGNKVGTAAQLAVDFISSENPLFIPGVSDGSLPRTDPYLLSLSTHLVFPTIMEGETAQSSFSMTGVNLTEGISLTLSGNEADYFSVEPSFIEADAANGTHEIVCTYLPATVGLHTTTLTISSEGAEDLVLPMSAACATQCAIAWKVDGQDYTLGDPTTAVAIGSQPAVIPTAPQSCSDESPQFVGWSAYLISGTNDETPADLFSDAADAPYITENTTFHAVFARMTQEGSSEPTIYSWTYGDTNTEWILSGNGVGGGSDKYAILKNGASITSPAFDLSRLESVTVSARTYGGLSFKTVSISVDDEVVGSVSATSSSMHDFTWTPEASLSGEGTLVFNSSTTNDSNGPGVKSITITCSGLITTYDRFVTTCTQPTDLMPLAPQTSPAHSAEKFLDGTSLYIKHNNTIYTILGEKIFIVN